MKIYFAASIRAGREYAKDYEKILELIKPFGDILTEHVGDANLTEEGEDLPEKEIHDRDLAWLFSSDAVVAEVTTPSLGVGYEIGRAIEKGIPVLCLVKESVSKHFSAMIMGSSDLEVLVYSSPEDVKDKLTAFFEKIR